MFNSADIEILKEELNLTEEEVQYAKELSYHDWFYHYSDDGGVWRRGEERNKELENKAKQLQGNYLKLWGTACKKYADHINRPIPKPEPVEPMEPAIKFYWTQAELAIRRGSYQQMSRLMKKAQALEADPSLPITDEDEKGKDIKDGAAHSAKKYVIYRKETHDGKKV